MIKLDRTWSVPSKMLLVGVLLLMASLVTAKEMSVRSVTEIVDTTHDVDAGSTSPNDTLPKSTSRKGRSKELTPVTDSIKVHPSRVDTVKTLGPKKTTSGAVVDSTKKTGPKVMVNQPIDSLKVEENVVADVLWDTAAFHTLENYWIGLYAAEKNEEKYSFRARRVLKALFYASVDERNPEPDYRKSYEYATILSKQTRVFGKWNEFENWRVVLAWVVDRNKVALALQEKYTALQKKAAKNTEAATALKNENGKLRQDITILKKEKRDLLTKIEELKKLEVLLEQERRR